MAGVSSLRKAGRVLKIREDYTLLRERYGQCFWVSKGVLLIDFLIEQRTINAAYCLDFLKDWVNPAFRSERRRQSVSQSVS